MRKILAFSTALATVAALSGETLAADPIKLQLGGFSNWYFGYVDQSRDPATGARFQGADVKGDNEIFFSGSTALDNGLTVGLNIEFEAGGITDTVLDPVDEAYVFVQGSFGKIIIGSEDNVAALLHVSAPDVSIGLQDGDYYYWVANPGVVDFFTTYASRDNDSDKLIYMTPQFAGFTAGVTYVPNVEECFSGGTNCGDRHTMMPVVTGDRTDAVAVALGYTKEYGSLAVAASLGYYHGWVEGFDGTDDFTMGLKLTYDAFSFGGSLRLSNEDSAWGGDRLDGKAWDIGGSYTTGPYAVSLGYYHSESDLPGVAQDDTTSVLQLSFNYALGPGINAVAAILNVDYEGAAAQADGWGGITGLRLTF